LLDATAKLRVPCSGICSMIERRVFQGPIWLPWPVRPGFPFSQGAEMSDTNGAGANPQDLPQLNVLTQFTKDLSFENPNAPKSLTGQQQAPNISIQVNVNAQKITDIEYEVTLHLEGAAGEGADTLFRFDLSYGGLFALRNIPEQDLQPVVLIECPRLLFPFARQIIADAVRNGGFPPLYIDPIDFVALFRQRLEQLQGAPAGTA